MQELVSRFGRSTIQRKLVAIRLERVSTAAAGTGQLKCCIVFGSFLTSKPDPNDVDIFLVMQDTFDLGRVTGEARLVCDHAAAQSHFGASVFWVRPATAFPDEAQAIAGWQLKRDGTRRGIVEVTGDQP